jgi:hypothetical protein
MRTLLITTFAGLTLLACSKPEAGGAATGAATGAAASKPAATGAAATPAKATAFTQKGIPAGKVVVGYIQDAADPSQCSVVTDAPAKKDAFAKDGEKFAEMVKGKLVPSCPTDNVVGTCNAGFGLLVNYSGPKWTAETAKKDCTGKPHQTWVE